MTDLQLRIKKYRWGAALSALFAIIGLGSGFLLAEYSTALLSLLAGIKFFTTAIGITTFSLLTMGVPILITAVAVAAGLIFAGTMAYNLFPKYTLEQRAQAKRVMLDTSVAAGFGATAVLCALYVVMHLGLGVASGGAALILFPMAGLMSLVMTAIFSGLAAQANRTLKKLDAGSKPLLAEAQRASMMLEAASKADSTAGVSAKPQPQLTAPKASPAVDPGIRSSQLPFETRFSFLSSTLGAVASAGGINAGQGRTRPTTVKKAVRRRRVVWRWKTKPAPNPTSKPRSTKGQDVPVERRSLLAAEAAEQSWGPRSPR